MASVGFCVIQMGSTDLRFCLRMLSAEFPSDGIKRFGVAAIALGVLAAACMLVVNRPERLTAWGAIWAAAILVVGLLPLVFYPWDRRRGVLPTLPVIGIFYAVFYGVSPFLLDLMFAADEPMSLWAIVSVLGVNPPYVRVLDATITGLAFAGVVSFLTMAWCIPRAFGSFDLLSIEAGAGAGKSKAMPLALLWGIVVLHLAVMSVPFLGRLPSLNQLAPLLGLFAFAALMLLALDGQLSRWHCAALFGIALPLRVAIGLSTATFNQIFLFVLFMGLAFFVRRFRLALAFMAVVLMLVFSLYHPLRYMRTVASYPEYVRADGLERLALFVKVARQPEKYLDTTVGDFNVFRRLASPLMLGATMQVTPEKVPYWGGETYKPLLTSFIPRVLWPGKPEERIGQEFGRRYSFIGPYDKASSVNLGWLIEFYVNFGMVGVVVGMAAVGTVFGGLQCLFNPLPQASALQTAYGLTVLFPFLNQDSNLSLSIGTVLPFAGAVWLMFWLLRRLQRHITPISE